MSGAGGGLVSLSSAEEVERAVGVRYRREVSDLGLGVDKYSMQRQLRSWGYEVKYWHCLQWLRWYRMGVKAEDSGAAVFEVSRVQLMRWHHVEGIGGRALQDKYRRECGVYAECRALEQWLRAPAQQLAALKANIDIHGDGCGEYALLELQKGRPAG